ncbi:calcium/calmodulin-dependent protein kinase I [Capsaspora owczarzaki ATCC 30864]|uniref:CAMK/CAMK1 protein kinase n=1 Tax=Capsaspora owczarzaki (strain ATCC 30864) TaxID=595528 RepID=A0A0D2WR41_CAPO3|nr:calcium/calmodulin-dependent protein kinase I [Capsaspora owczarzaki ATCC 30864]KJE94315.1 CAMK/CAMK1 protein kinase [Capsaspora owczarzaki ATCC 30864]|eukprot:XP_004346659.1 calcium/calmodulin-dependent protein kinase I [Capsaspora owczarzaki ATCC 30864]
MQALKNKLKKYVPRHNKLDVEKHYKIGKELGSGNFAVVKAAVKRDTNQKVAIKMIDKKLCEGKEDMIETEVAILRQVQHPNIVGMIEEFDTPEKLYLVLELVEGGELFDRIVDHGSFTEQDASRLIRQITAAVKYLHERDIVHRDLKPENLLFRTPDHDSDIMITDFGLSKLINENLALETACGTPNYVAPEILLQKGYGKPVDIWSIGVITFILLCGYPPFYDESDALLFQKIMKGKFAYDPSYWSTISDSAKDVISSMLIVDPNRRLTADQVLAHPWVSGKTARDVNLSDSISQNLKSFSSGRVMFRKAIAAVQATNRMKRLALSSPMDNASHRSEPTSPTSPSSDASTSDGN